MKRNPRKVKWTKAYRRVHRKDMTQDSTFEFERKQNRPERYDRNLAENVLKAIPKIEKIRFTREERHHKNRNEGQERKDTKGGSKGVGAGHQVGQISFGPSEGPISYITTKDQSLCFPTAIRGQQCDGAVMSMLHSVCVCVSFV
ncbi:hypothetical protein Ahy_B01g057033 isoform B [Arachis hypogaea]|uniref:Large ribosomal subunit protein eL24-related N-terminal domain-containing protein n=1 Tax=Arachis hypogaea TaxID=3818 RepID=A0A445B053_ARAHY|nr:hypothetical protein Ahy_B01g057033 isoform B [Arachis hypogaea]